MSWWEGAGAGELEGKGLQQRWGRSILQGVSVDAWIIIDIFGGFCLPLVLSPIPTG